VTRQPRPAPLVAALVGLALATGTAAAGEGHGTDLFAGYSFAQIQDNNRNGANLALCFDFVGPVSGFVDTSFHWGSQEGTSLSDLTLTAGPGVRFGKRGGTVFFVRALAGLVQDKASIGVFDVDISETSTSFGILAGGGVDFRVSTTLALRLQGDYLASDNGTEGIASCPPTPSGVSCEASGGGWSSGYRVSAGIVYRFGSAR
jgi:opacity protein-like surface antigen